MTNTVLRILESVKNNTDVEVYDSIIKTCGIFEDESTPDKQYKYIKAVLHKLENAYGEEVVAKVMKPCGHQCISKGIIAKAKSFYKKAVNLDDFLRLLNEHHIGGGKLHIKDGKIIGIYEKCYCGLAKHIKGISSTYCNCSVGWYEHLFSSVFNKKVDVRKIQTILDGSDQCVFEIKIQEYC